MIFKKAVHMSAHHPGTSARLSDARARRSPAAPILWMGPRAGQGSLPRVASPLGGLRAASDPPAAGTPHRTAGSSGTRRGATDTWWHFLPRRQGAAEAV